MNEKILIVEDEAIIYDDLYRALKKHHFEVDEYTPSYKEAIERIGENRPDIALLDIKLIGKKTGIDLGKVLYEEYKIPFIYVTDFDDAHTFHKGLQSGADYYVVKTKPVLNIDDVIRAINVLLYKKDNLSTDNNAIYYNDKPNNDLEKIGIIGLIDYPNKIKKLPKNTISRIPVRFDEIGFFTTAPITKTNEQGKKEVIEVRKNFVRFKTKDGKTLFYNGSLSALENVLPDYFIRAGDSYIITKKPELIDGLINGKNIIILGEKIEIGDSFKKDIRKFFNENFI